MVIPNVRNIGNAAFSNCSGMTGTLVIPSSLETIGQGAFYSANLTGLDLSGATSLKIIGYNAFMGWPQSVPFSGTLYIPKSVSLTTGTFGSGVTIVRTGNDPIAPPSIFLTGYRTEGYTWSAEDEFDPDIITNMVIGGIPPPLINIPSNIRKIHPGGLWLSNVGSSSTTDYTIDFSNASSLTDIPRYVVISSSGSLLGGRTRVKNINNLEYAPLLNIGTRAFRDATNATGTYRIPSYVTVGTNAFPAGVTTTQVLVSDLFSFDQSNNTILTGIGEALTGPCIIPPFVTEIADDAFNGNAVITSLNLTLATNLTSIGARAFIACVNLERTVKIPSSVTIIKDSAFSSEVPNFTAAQTTNKISSLDLTNATSLITIEDNAFKACGNLTGTIEFPPALATIGANAFSDCSGLTTLYFGYAVSLTTIGSSAFQNCSGLTGTLTIPSYVTNIGANAFYNCSGLTGSLTIPPSVTFIGPSAFYDCSGFTGTLIIPSSLAININASAFRGCSGFNSLIFGANSPIRRIDPNAFKDCSGFTGTLTIPSSVTTIDISAFEGCTGITGLIIPPSVISIKANAFANCTGLNGSTVSIRADATVAASAFSGTTVTIVRS